MQMTFVWWPSTRRYDTASRMEPKTELTDEQWSVIEDLFPWTAPSRAGGRPLVPPRPCLEGILWILRSGARWKDLPKSFPSYATCWRRLQTWSRSGIFQNAWQRCLRELDGLGEIDWKTALADGMFARAKKGGDCVGKTKCGKGTKVMTMVDRDGIPLALAVYSATPSEVRLIEPMLTHRVLARLPQRLVYDRAADSDPLRERLRERGIELVCPHRKGRKKPPTQDGRKLKIYKHRWPVERTNAWLQNFRRVLVRQEYYSENYLAFVQAACLIVTLRKLHPAKNATCSLTA